MFGEHKPSLFVVDRGEPLLVLRPLDHQALLEDLVLVLGHGALQLIVIRARRRE